MRRLATRDRWYAVLIWVPFLSGAVIDAEWFEREEMDRFRQYVLLAAGLLLLAALSGKLIGTAIAVPMGSGRLLRERELTVKAA